MRRHPGYPIAALALLAAISSAFVSCKGKPTAWDPSQGVTQLYDVDARSSLKPPSSDLAKRVAEIIQERLDPKGTGEIVVRSKGISQVEVWVHFPKASQDAAAELQSAKDALDATSISWEKVAQAAKLKGEERAKAIDAIVPAGDPRNELIKKCMTSNDVYSAATARVADAEKKLGLAGVPVELRDAKATALRRADDAFDRMLASGVNLKRLENILAAADDPSNTEAAGELAKLSAEFPSQKAAIERLIAAHKKLVASIPPGSRSPEDVEHIALAGGVIDFRITVLPEELGGVAGADYDSAVRSLERDGSAPALSVGGIRSRWFKIDSKAAAEMGSAWSFRNNVVASWDGASYILCYDDPAHAMTHSGGADWTIMAGVARPDPSTGRASLPFSLDTVGSVEMSEVTGGNKGRSMAILLDDQVMSAPTINDRIDGNGMITFSSKGKAGLAEAEDLQHILDAGSLPAPLKKPAAPASGASH